MKFRIRFAEQLVGAFLLVALLAIAVILVFLGINQRWFARNYEFLSRFDSGGGLSVGMPIMLKGFTIGQIDAIELNEDNQVDVRFSVQDTYYEKVLPGSVLELTSSPIGLGVTLNFHPGSAAGPPLPELSFIPSLDLPEGRQLVEAGKVVLPKGEDVIGSVIAKLNPILDEARTTIAQIKRVVNTVDLALQGRSGPVGEMVVDLARTPDKVNALIDDVNARVAGIAGQANALLDRIDGIAADLARLAATAQGTIDSLSADLDVIAGNLTTATDGLTETRGLVTRLIDPKGSLATILNDQNALYGQIEGSLRGVQDAVAGVNRIVEQVNGFVEYLNGARPQISGLLETGRTTLEKGNDVLEAVKNNPLLKGGVPEATEQTSTLKSYRDEDF